ncbi:MAG: hypothetical protein EOP62_21725 [Sphingomonadales bacterium]|nr:MAG: hypothetical protein EOP62_21725 [Sphingomonadales bacterium]
MTPERAASLGPGYIYSFAAAWDKALHNGLEHQIETAPMGVEEQVPIIRRGAIIGWRTRINSRLALAALGAFRRSTEGQSFDHDYRIARRTALFAEKVEALVRLGPIRWPDPEPAECPDERRARLRRERKLDRIYGKPEGGLRDGMRPVGTAMRTLAEQEAALRPPRFRPEPIPPQVRLL